MTTNYTKIAKASGTSYTKIAKPTAGQSISGSPIGMLLSLTYATIIGGIYTKIPKASGTLYTKIIKAT